MNRNVVIIGASGHGKVIADIVKCSGDRVVGFLDDNPYLTEGFVGFPLLGTVNEYAQYSDCEFVVGIGNAAVRERIANQLVGVVWYTAIHPSAVISDLDTDIGEGSVVMANAVINPGAKIGRHCIINTGAIVDHDNRIDDFTHISVSAKLAGTVSIGKRTWIGIGASIKNNISICSDCMIGAGAVVVHDITESGTYIGVPACKRERERDGARDEGIVLLPSEKWRAA